MNKIKFVRIYRPSYATVDYFDVYYHSGRIRTNTFDEMPKTVQEFCAKAKNVKCQYDPVFKWNEVIYQ